MRFAMIGLGRMGRSLAGLAVRRGHEVVGWDPDEQARSAAAAHGIEAADTIVTAAEELPTPRVILLLVPHGAPVDANLAALRPVLAEGDIVADCGNSHWEDSRRRHDELAADGIAYLDIGTSGGISDALGWEGAAFMAGGPEEAFAHVRPLLRDLAVSDGAVFYAGPSPSGHFVKLVHNAIEFGMIQAIAEGVELLDRFPGDIDAPAVLEHWNHGTVIRSWLVELMGNALRSGGIGPEQGVAPEMAGLSTYVEDTGEVKWVVEWAMREDVPVPVTALAQQMLMSYRNLDWTTAKAVALLRNQFGGHPIRRLDVDGHASRRR